MELYQEILCHVLANEKVQVSFPELVNTDVIKIVEPGMSITIMQRMYHDFEVEPGTGAVLIGEVSQCNDDNTDNRFNPPAGRFPEIEEDEPPYRLLCNEYPQAPEKSKTPQQATGHQTCCAAELRGI